MTDAAAAVILGAIAIFFAWTGYGHAKARLTGRATSSAARIGDRRPGSYGAALVFLMLALLFAAGAMVSLEQALSA